MHVEENGIGPSGLMFPAELVVPPRATKPGLSEAELEALGSESGSLTIQRGQQVTRLPVDRHRRAVVGVALRVLADNCSATLVLFAREVALA